MRIVLLNFLLIALIHLSFTAFGQKEKREYFTKKIETTPPKINGLEDDPSWELVEWGGDFIQRIPEDSAAPSHPTLFKILYDDKNLYVLIRAFDDNPDKIVKRMSRRDGFEGDWVEINIDSREDQRTAFSFTASVSGVKGDEYVSNDGSDWDSTWDPIWYLGTSIDDKGWIAEFRIPLSQLRFANKEEQNWGIQVQRRFFRNSEQSLWQYFSRKETGWVRHFGILRGIKGIKPQKQLEIMPYVVGKYETSEAEEGNPFNDGSRFSGNVGVDGKVGLTSEITLDFTINPDFGQVEADPSQINLTAYRLFFNERRPFFIEGKDLFDFRPTESWSGGSFNLNRLFYSRNVGRPPRYYPDLMDNEYADVPEETAILTAVKITGKNRNGFSWGISESLTANEYATIDRDGERRKEKVEPLTNYLIGRMQREYNKGNTVIGGMFTSTHRSIDEPQLEFLRKSAYSGGLDLIHYWKDRNYYLFAKGSYSNVQGSPASILKTQTAAERFFQRPDNHHEHVDSTRTSLEGWTSNIMIGKNYGKIRGQTGIITRSPGYEVNDAGFLINTDQINHWTWIGYRTLEPKGIFRQFSLDGHGYLHWDFGGVNIYKGLNFNSHSKFKNFWELSLEYVRNGSNISNADLRGGPAIRYPGSNQYFYWLSTDRRKKLILEFSQEFEHGDQNLGNSIETSVEINYQPINALFLSLEPGYYTNLNTMQYVTTREAGGEPRYVVGEIDQKTWVLSARANFIITPNMSLQFWGQPFMSSGKYRNFKKITDPKNNAFEDRYYLYANEISYNKQDELYSIDENGDNTAEFSFYNPDFNFVQFRSNLVFRWEYIPGSEFYVVWTQERTNNLTVNTDRSFSQMKDGLKNTFPDNVFLIKYTYRFRR